MNVLRITHYGLALEETYICIHDVNVYRAMYKTYIYTIICILKTNEATSKKIPETFNAI